MDSEAVRPAALALPRGGEERQEDQREAPAWPMLLELLAAPVRPGGVQQERRVVGYREWPALAWCPARPEPPAYATLALEIPRPEAPTDRISRELRELPVSAAEPGAVGRHWMVQRPGTAAELPA